MVFGAIVMTRNEVFVLLVVCWSSVRFNGRLDCVSLPRYSDGTVGRCFGIVFSFREIELPGLAGTNGLLVYILNEEKQTKTELCIVCYECFYNDSCIL